jgi:hypothetical protein
MSEQPAVLRWENPPPARNRGNTAHRSKWDHAAQQLRDRCGQWGVLEERAGDHNTGLASNITRGAIDCFTPRGDFEAVLRRIGGKSVVYARYLGDQEDDDA